MPRTDARVYFTGGQTRVPGLRFNGHDSRRAADRRGLLPHDHGDAYELCLIVRGNVDWWVGQEVHEVGPGELYLTRPHERHGGVDSMLQPCELYWAGFVLDGARGLAGLNRTESRQLAKRYAGLTQRQFRADRDTAQCFARLIRAQSDGGVFAAAEARTAFLSLLLSALRCHDEHESQRHRTPRAVRDAMRRMLDHLDQNLGLPELAESVGLSPKRLNDVFTAALGCTPGRWRTLQRVKQAKVLLRQSELSVTDIALRCGFASSQYFATTFKRHVGSTPGRYRLGR